MTEPVFCKGCASILGESETLVRCGRCLFVFHWTCYRWRHGCDTEWKEIDDGW